MKNITEKQAKKIKQSIIEACKNDSGSYNEVMRKLTLENSYTHII